MESKEHDDPFGDHSEEDDEILEQIGADGTDDIDAEKYGEKRGEKHGGEPESDGEEDADAEDLAWDEYDDKSVDIAAPGQSATKIIKIIPQEKHDTSDMATDYEIVRVLGDRGRHIELGANPFVSTDGCTTPAEIAFRELIQRKLPMCIHRETLDGYVEIKKVSEMVLPPLNVIARYLKIKI